MVISFPVFSVFLEEENKQYKSICVIVIVIQLIRKPITELKKTSFHCFNRNTHTGHVGADIWSFDRELYYQRKEKKIITNEWKIMPESSQLQNICFIVYPSNSFDLFGKRFPNKLPIPNYQCYMTYF